MHAREHRRGKDNIDRRGLKDALRIYAGGIRFTALNIGNIHHENGRRITPYVIVDGADEDILRRFRQMGCR